ncbi:MAG: glycine cleavage system protein GcvH [Actinomycetota bacterium]|jgi:glycine cleavage system H protein
MANPTNLAYTKEHEWVLVEGSVATVGITKYAADALGEVVYIDLPKVGAATTYLKIFGEVESTKSVSELYSPITGEVVEVNATVTASPELINSDAFGAGWLIKVKFAELPAELLSSTEYDALTGEA